MQLCLFYRVATVDLTPWNEPEKLAPAHRQLKHSPSACLGGAFYPVKLQGKEGLSLSCKKRDRQIFQGQRRTRLQTTKLATVVTCDAASRQSPLGENRVRRLLSAPKESWRHELHSPLTRSSANTSAIQFVLWHKIHCGHYILLQYSSSAVNLQQRVWQVFKRTF